MDEKILIQRPVFRLTMKWLPNFRKWICKNYSLPFIQIWRQETKFWEPHGTELGKHETPTCLRGEPRHSQPQTGSSSSPHSALPPNSPRPALPSLTWPGAVCSRFSKEQKAGGPWTGCGPQQLTQTHLCSFRCTESLGGKELWFTECWVQDSVLG